MTFKEKFFVFFKERKSTPFPKTCHSGVKTYMQLSFYWTRFTHPFGRFFIDVQGKPSINSCDRHETGRGLHLAREIRTQAAWWKSRVIWSHYRRNNLKADVSYIIDHIQSPNAYTVRSKNQVKALNSRMKKILREKKGEKVSRNRLVYITYLEKSALWQKFVF